MSFQIKILICICEYDLCRMYLKKIKTFEDIYMLTQNTYDVCIETQYSNREDKLTGQD